MAVLFRAPVALEAPPWPKRYVWIGVGRAVNQLGVVPALNSEAISEETAPGFVKASATRDDGRAVARTA